MHRVLLPLATAAALLVRGVKTAGLSVAAAAATTSGVFLLTHRVGWALLAAVPFLLAAEWQRR